MVTFRGPVLGETYLTSSLTPDEGIRSSTKTVSSTVRWYAQVGASQIVMMVGEIDTTGLCCKKRGQLLKNFNLL